MVSENAHVKAERQRLIDEWDRGAAEGYNAPANRLPDFFVKPYNMLTAYQRGYLFGRELKIREGDDG